MTSWRRTGWIAMLAALALLVSACGRGEDEGTGGGDGGGTSPGISDSEIKLGGSYPFSGPASAYRAIADGAKARFEVVNAEGGIDGRKIEFITLDDAYEPPKAVQNARRLIEQEQVFALFNTLGTPNNLAMWDYVNEREVPHVYVATGASDWGADIEGHPWTIGWQPNYVTEARVYAEFLKQEKPNAKVAALYQNDDFGKDLLGGFEEAIAGSNIKVVAKKAYEVTAPTVASEVKALANSDADTFLNITTPKAAAQAIGTVAATGWKPLHILNNVGSSKSLVLAAVGLENAKGIVSTAYFKDPEDPQWEGDPAMTEYKDALKEHVPRADPNEPFRTYGWAAASTLVKALENMKEPTREALMDAVRNMDEEIPILLPDVRVQTGPDDGYPIEAMQIMRFDGENWQLEGELIQAEGQ
jgi:branched-chain amino acid transport system substrate-binding protein